MHRNIIYTNTFDGDTYAIQLELLTIIYFIFQYIGPCLGKSSSTNSTNEAQSSAVNQPPQTTTVERTKCASRVIKDLYQPVDQVTRRGPRRNSSRAVSFMKGTANFLGVRRPSMLYTYHRYNSVEEARAKKNIIPR